MFWDPLGFEETLLKVPATILFILFDACSHSIAKLFGVCSCGVSHNCHAYDAKFPKGPKIEKIQDLFFNLWALRDWVSHRRARVKLSSKEGVAPFWGMASFTKKASSDTKHMGIQVQPPDNHCKPPKAQDTTSKWFQTVFSKRCFSDS